MDNTTCEIAAYNEFYYLPNPCLSLKICSSLAALSKIQAYTHLA